MPLLEPVIVTLCGSDAPDLGVTGWMLRDCPGIAITPARTGAETTSLTYYCITHTASGMRIGEQYTAFEAVNLMSELCALDVDWTQDRDALQDKALYKTTRRILSRYIVAGDDED